MTKRKADDPRVLALIEKGYTRRAALYLVRQAEKEGR